MILADECKKEAEVLLSGAVEFANRGWSNPELLSFQNNSHTHKVPYPKDEKIGQQRQAYLKVKIQTTMIFADECRKETEV